MYTIAGAHKEHKFEHKGRQLPQLLVDPSLALPLVPVLATLLFAASAMHGGEVKYTNSR